MLNELGVGDRRRSIRYTCASISREDILSQSPQGCFLGGHYVKVKS